MPAIGTLNSSSLIYYLYVVCFPVHVTITCTLYACCCDKMMYVSCINGSTDDDERVQQKARLEDDLNVASERLENLVKGVCCECECAGGGRECPHV